MSTTDTQAAPAVDIERVVALLPADVRATARLRLAAVADATSDEERARIKAIVVDETLDHAARGNWCSAAEQALTLTFGEPEGGRWVRSDGFDRAGFDRDGFSRDGWHRVTGRNREGFDRNGRDEAGYNAEGLDEYGYTREGLDKDGRSKFRFDLDGWDSEGFNREGFDREGFDREGYGRDGFNREGLNRQGEDMFRFDRNLTDRDGYNTDGHDYYGYNRAWYAANPGRIPRPASGRRHPLYDRWLRWHNAGEPDIIRNPDWDSAHQA